MLPCQVDMTHHDHSADHDRSTVCTVWYDFWIFLFLSRSACKLFFYFIFEHRGPKIPYSTFFPTPVSQVPHFSPRISQISQFCITNLPYCTYIFHTPNIPYSRSCVTTDCTQLDTLIIADLNKIDLKPSFMYSKWSVLEVIMKEQKNYVWQRNMWGDLMFYTFIHISFKNTDIYLHVQDIICNWFLEVFLTAGSWKVIR